MTSRDVRRPSRRVCCRDELQALPKGTAHCAGALVRRCNALHRLCAQLSCSEVVQPRFLQRASRRRVQLVFRGVQQ